MWLTVTPWPRRCHCLKGRLSLSPEPLLIQRHAAPDVGGHVEVFAVVDRRFALLESAFGNDVQRQRALAHFRPRLAIRLPILPGQHLFFLLRRHLGRRRDETRRRTERRGFS